jgi:hypothetical protein
LLYDAWARWSAGDLDAARSLLAAAPQADGIVGRSRTILAALLARHAGKRATADTLLASIESDDAWHDTEDPELMALGVWAARIRLTVDLAAELRLLRRVTDRSDTRFSLIGLEQGMVVLPTLAVAARRSRTTVEQRQPLTIPVTEHEVQRFAEAIAESVGFLDTGESGLAAVERLQRVNAWESFDKEESFHVAFRNDPPKQEAYRWSMHLMVLGWRRLAFVAASTTLSRCCGRALREDETRLSTSVVATLFALRGNNLRYAGSQGMVTLDDIVEQLGRRHDNSYDTILKTPFSNEIAETGNFNEPAARLYLVGPDPLETLLSVVAGIPAR